LSTASFNTVLSIKIIASGKYNMPQQNFSRWDLGRFLQTLCYFGVIPFWGKSSSLQSFMGDLNVSNPQSEASSAGDSVPNAFSRASEKILFDFSQASTGLSDIWGAVDDVVMGGVSASSIRLEDGKALFSGNVSTDNSGGFASVRTRNVDPPIDLANYDGIELRVRGDGKRYKFMLRTSTQWDGIAYCYSFDTVMNDWLDVRIPFSKFVPISRARTVSNAEPLATKHICALQLMLSKFEYDGALNPKFNSGFFELQVQSIGAYRVV
jgi:Complex I intermediate-associated protein 30 (CIA30)